VSIPDFEAFLTLHKTSISELSARLLEKLTTTEFQTYMSTKIDAEDVSKIFQKIKTEIDATLLKITSE
jgi:hypothetical protein